MKYAGRTGAGAIVVAVAAAWALVGSEQAGEPKQPVAPPLRAVGAIMPALSDSGEQIAFSYQGAIWRMPRAGGAMTRLTFDEGFDLHPAWSPDGALVAFAKTRDFAAGPLRVIRAADGAVQDLPGSPSVRGPSFFASEGRRILGLFVGEDGKSQRLAWLDLATGKLGPTVYALQMRQKFALSHDRQTIVATATRDMPDEQSGNFGPRTTLWQVPAEGGEPHLLGEWPARIHELCFTADDKALIVATDLGGAHHDLWRVPLADVERGATRLTTGGADESAPSVSVDGRWLLYTDNTEGPTALVLRDLLGGGTSVVETTELDFARPTGRIELNIVDASADKPLTARCSLRHDEGKYHAPPGALYRVRGEMHSYVEGTTQFAVPAGRYQIRVARGPEYHVARVSVEVRAGETTTQTVRLERWINQAARGWYSGESHIHANYGYGHWYNSPATMRAQCSGEDLMVCNLMVANSDGDGVFDREYFRGRPDPLSTPETVLYWNEEYRSTIWGHMTLLNLKQLVGPIFTGFPHTTNPHDHPTNADSGLATHDIFGHVNYTHPASNEKDAFDSAYAAKGLPVDVALGTVDSIDVMGSSHKANLPLWYRLLNCGFRIPASAGTDCFLNRIPSVVPGADRCYVRLDDDKFSYDQWIAGLKAGRTFVTNGPMLDVTVEGKLPGETLRLDGPRRVKIVVNVRAAQSLDRVEIVKNGLDEIIAECKEAGTDFTKDLSIDVTTGGWLAVRVIGPAHPLSTRGEAFAHTSPVYIEVKDSPPDAEEDARYFLTWIDRLWKEVRRRNRIPPRHQVHVESQIAAARAVYQKLIDGR